MEAQKTKPTTHTKHSYAPNTQYQQQYSSSLIGDNIMNEINNTNYYEEEYKNNTVRCISAPPANATLQTPNTAQAVPANGTGVPNSTMSNSNSSALFLNNNGNIISINPSDPRCTPGYYSYYYSQRPLDPRLPPPLFNLNAWHAAQTAQNTTLNNRMDNLAISQTNSASETDSTTISSSNSSVTAKANNTNSNTSNSSKQSVKPPLVDMIQSDFPRTPSPMFTNQQLAAQFNNLNPSKLQNPPTNLPTNNSSLIFPPVNSNVNEAFPNAFQQDNFQQQANINNNAGNTNNISPMMAVIGFGQPATNKPLFIPANINVNGNTNTNNPAVFNLTSPLILSHQEYQSLLPGNVNLNTDFVSRNPQSSNLAVNNANWDSNSFNKNNNNLRPLNVNNIFTGAQPVSTDIQQRVQFAVNNNNNMSFTSSSSASTTNSNNTSNGKLFSVDPHTHNNTIHGAARALLDEFRSTKGNSKLSLSEVAKQALVVELAVDQHGSRFIQQRLEVASPEEKQMVFDQLLPDTMKLCTDVFGNYVIQKILEFGLPEHRKQIAERIENHVYNLALQMYGCRVIQKALEVFDEHRQAHLVSELVGHVMPLVLDQNGNHVIQKCIERVPSHHIQFIVDDFKNQVNSLASHPYGCRVIQRLLEHCNNEQKTPILDEILSTTLELVQDQYGNYVIQHVLERGSKDQRTAIIMRLHGSLLSLSKHKFASNVIEKCFQHGTDAERNLLIDEVIGKGNEGVAPISNMVKDQYANYVVQKIIDVVQGSQRARFIEGLKNKVPNLRKMTYGKHIIAKIEKLTNEPY